MNSDQTYFTEKKTILEHLVSDGVKDLKTVIEILLNEAMKIERQEALKVAPYERSPERVGYANGYKNREYTSRMGSLRIQIPQVRGLSFYPRCLEKGERCEKALKLAIAEMYIQGVSTRNVQAITEELCGFEISSTQVSRCANLLDEELQKFRERALTAKYAYVYFDAIYEKVRHDHSVIDMATLIAVGVTEDGKREILGISSRLSEAEVHWRAFFEDLQKRGLSGVRLFISDDHAGMGAARKAVFPAVKWQRCQFHMAQNAQSYAPKESMREELGEAVRRIFHSCDYAAAQEEKRKCIERYKISAPAFVKWVESSIDEGLSCFSFPEGHRKRIRTVNGLERLNREIRRRTRVATLFPNVASCQRLITAVLQGVHEEWITGRQYLDMSLLD
jgi:transposase-like protein